MSNITWTIDFTGTPDDEDKEAALRRIGVENDRITAANVGKEPEDQEDLLETEPAATLKRNYLALRKRDLEAAHLGDAKIAGTESWTARRQKWLNATDMGRNLADGVLSANQRS